MKYCSKCGKEMPEDTNFCPNCGAQQGGEEPKFGSNKSGKILAVVLLVLAIVDLFSDPAILTILLSIAIIAGAAFCLGKKYKLKGLTIAALIIAAFCLYMGGTQAKRIGLLTMPGTLQHASRQSQEIDTAVKPEAKESVPKADNGVKEDTSKTEVKESTPNTEEKEVAGTQESEKTEAPEGVDPDLKEFLDSYEDFIDEYVEFMKKYKSDSGNTMALLGEYSEIMTKYADFAEKVNNYNSSNLSAEDYKYYIEVTTRCTQKMLEAY